MKKYISRRVTEEEYQGWKNGFQYFARVSYVICEEHCDPYFQIKFEAYLDNEDTMTDFLNTDSIEKFRRNIIEKIIGWMESGLSIEDIEILTNNKFSSFPYIRYLCTAKKIDNESIKLSFDDTRGYKNIDSSDPESGFEVFFHEDI